MSVDVVIATTRPLVSDLIDSLMAGSRQPDGIIIVSNEYYDSRATNLSFTSAVHPIGRGDAGLRRNIGADHSGADVLLFLDDDVLAPRSLVETAVDITERDGMCWGHHRYIDIMAYDRETLLDLDPEEGHSRESGVNRWHGFQSSYAGNFAITRDRFWEVGGFDLAYLGYHGSEDQQLGRRLAQPGEMTFVHEPPFAWHPTAQSYHTDPVTNVSGDHRLTTKTVNGHDFSVCEECPCRMPTDVGALTLSLDVVIPFHREDFTVVQQEAGLAPARD